VTLTSLKVKVNEINEMFLDKHGILELKEASLSHITLDPINTLIHHSSCNDPCHITFHNIYAHIALKEVPPAHLAAAGGSKEKIHEIASELIGDLLAEWMVEREKTKRIVKEMKDQVASPHLSPNSPHQTQSSSRHTPQAQHSHTQQSDEVRKSSQQMIDNVLDKLQVHLLGMKIDIQLSSNEVVRVEIPEVHYKDQSYMKTPDMRIEVYQLVTPQVTVSQLDVDEHSSDKASNEEANADDAPVKEMTTSTEEGDDQDSVEEDHSDDNQSCTSDVSHDDDSSNQQQTPSSSSIPSTNSKSFFDSVKQQILLHTQQLILTVTLPGDHSILIRAHQQQIFGLLMPRQTSSIASLLEIFTNAPQNSENTQPEHNTHNHHDTSHNTTFNSSMIERTILPDEIKQLNQNQMTSRGQAMSDSRLSLANSNMDDSLLFQSFYDENPEVRVSTRITADFISVYYLYDDHCLCVDELTGSTIFPLGDHKKTDLEDSSLEASHKTTPSGLRITLKKIQVEIPQRREFSLSIPFLRLEEFHNGKNTVVLSKNLMTTAPDSASATHHTHPNAATVTAADLPFFLLHIRTERASHERDIVHQTIALGAVKALLDLALIERIRESLPPKVASVFGDGRGAESSSPPAGDSPNHDLTNSSHPADSLLPSQMFVHITDTHLKVNLHSIHLDIEHTGSHSQFDDDSLNLALETFTVDRQTFNLNMRSSTENFNTAYTSIDAKHFCLSLLHERDCSYPLFSLSDLIVKVENRREMFSVPSFEPHTAGGAGGSSSSDRISQALFDLGTRDFHEHYFNFSPVAVSVFLAHSAVIITKHEFVRIQEMMQALMNSLSGGASEQNVKNSPSPQQPSTTSSFPDDPNLRALVYNVVPGVSATVTLKKVALQLRDVCSPATTAESPLLHHYDIAADQTLILFDSYSANAEGNTKSNIFAECLGHLVVDELFVDSEPNRRPLLKSHSALVKDFRLYKQPLVANIELEKNTPIDRMGVKGLISVNGMQLFHTATPPEDIFVMGIIDFLSNPDVPPPAISDVSVDVAVNNSLIDYQSPNCNARLVLNVDSLLVEAQVQDPPTSQNINVVLHLGDETEVLVHKDFRSGSIITGTSHSTAPRHFSLSSHLQNNGFVPVLQLDQFSMRVILLGDKITPTRQTAPIQLHVNDGRITVGVCKDSLTLLQKLGTDYQSHVECITTQRMRTSAAQHGHDFAQSQNETQKGNKTSAVTTPTPQLLSSFNFMDIDETYFRPTEQQRKRVGSLGVKVTSHHAFNSSSIVQDYFTVPKRYRSRKSNSRAPLAKFLPVANVEVTLMLDIYLTIYEGEDWSENPHLSTLSSNSRESKSNLSAQLTEVFAQIDLFPPPPNTKEAHPQGGSNSHVMHCRASVQDLHVQYRDAQANSVSSILKRQPWRFIHQRPPPRLCDLQFHLRRDSDKILHVDLDVSHIYPIRLFLSVPLYQFVIGLLSGPTPEEIIPSTNLENELLLRANDSHLDDTQGEASFNSAPQSADIIFDSFKIAPLRCVANAPFVTVRDARLSLFGVSYSDIRGTEQLLKVLTADTSQELRRHSLFNLATSLFFVRNIKGVTDGTYDLIAMPYTHIVRDGRVLYGIQMGITSFLSSFVSETVGCTSDVTYVLGEGMQYVKDVLHKDTDDANEAQMNPEPPESGLEAYNHARVVLLKSVKGAYQPIIAIPTKYRQQGTGAVAKSLVKALPIMVLSPSAGVVRALSSVLYGFQASLNQGKNEGEEFYQDRGG